MLPVTTAHENHKEVAASMREQFQQDLNQVSDELVEMTRLAASAMSRATTALLDADVHLAESVIANDQAIDAAREALDARSVDLLARQAPVATDLRMVVTAMRMSSDLERMGDLARHVAKIARLRFPSSAVPPELRSTITEMGHVAQALVTKVGSIIADHDVAAARELEADDDAMDELHRDLYAHLVDGNWKHGTESAVDLTLLGRYYERFGDHAVSVAERVIYLVTGEYDSSEEPEDPAVVV